MVDIDKIRNRQDKKKSRQKQEKEEPKKKKSKSKPKKKKSSSDDKEMTKQQKMDLLKGKSPSKTQVSGSGEQEDIKTLLFTLGNIELFTSTLKQADLNGISKADKKIKNDVVQDVRSEVVDFLGVFNAYQLSEKYGYGWKQILEHIKTKKDRTGSKMSTNDGKVQKQHVRDLLDCIANITLYTEGVMRQAESKKKQNRTTKTTRIVSESLFEFEKQVISQTGVQRIAEKYGWDWKDDILMNVLDGQDFSSKIEQHK